MDPVTNFLFLLLLVLIGLIVRARQERRRTKQEQWEDKENRPDILKKSRLVLSETRIQCNRPAPFRGRVDQVYQLENGELCIVDSKRRKQRRVYPYDIIQGSVYALILRQKGNRVHPIAYVRRVGHDGTVDYLPYEVLTDDQVLALKGRLELVRQRPEMARKNAPPTFCRKCDKRERGLCAGVQ